MIRPELYQSLYLAIVSILTIVLVLFKAESKRHIIPSINLTLFLIFFIGLRPISGVFVDMVNYHDYFEHLRLELSWNAQNLIFDNLFSFFSINGWSDTYFYLLIAFIYFGSILWACIKIFPKNTFIALLVYLIAFSTFSYGTNGIKAGAASAIFLLAIAYRKNFFLSLLFALISIGFHHSMLVVAISFYIVYFIKGNSIFFTFWVVCLLIATFHITFFQELFSIMAEDVSYLNILDDNSNGYFSGFRPDFILYSSIPIIIQKLLQTKYVVKSENYDFLMNLYMLVNGIWMLCMYASFTNRIAYLSWFILPIAIIYPFLKLKGIKENDKYLLYVIFGHMGFTLFMTFIYYA